MTCEGGWPVLHLDGAVSLGRVAFRSAAARPEIGASDGGHLTVGDRVFINHGASVVAHREIAVGDGCRIGEFAAIFDTNHHRVDEATPVVSGPVALGRNVWVGRGAVILPGVQIGDHAVIAALSVVTEDVPPRTLVAGAPARFVRSLTASDGWERD
ncbi:MAG TPA: acyltransferase [Mycobacterium sp.]